MQAVGWTSAAQSTNADAVLGGLRYRSSTLPAGTMIKAHQPRACFEYLKSMEDGKTEVYFHGFPEHGWWVNWLLILLAGFLFYLGQQQDHNP